MHVGNQRCSEIRGFSTTAYYQGAAGALPGGAARMVASVLARVNNTTGASEWLASNRSGGGTPSGWAIYRTADTDSGFNAACEFNAQVWNGAGGSTTLTVALPKSFVLGRLLRLDMYYDVATTTLQLYMNGQLVRENTAAVAAAASTGTPYIGAFANTFYAANTSIIDVAYASGLGAGAVNDIAGSYVEGLKRADIQSYGNLEYTHRYSARTLAGFAGAAGAGYPRTLVDTIGTEDFSFTGAGSLVVGNPQVVWAVARNEEQPG